MRRRSDGFHGVLMEGSLMGLADIVGKINVVWEEQHSPRTAF